MLLHLPFLGLALFSSPALTMTIPQGTSLTTPTTSPHTNGSLNATSNGAYVCSKRGAQMRTQPDFADCAGALRSVPLDPTIGTFYNSGRGDFQLPHFETSKTCLVVIELRSPYDKVQSSWLAVHVAAMELNVACQDLREAPGLGSAYTFLDDMSQMKITLKGAQKQLGDGDDGTDANATA